MRAYRIGPGRHKERTQQRGLSRSNGQLATGRRLTICVWAYTGEHIVDMRKRIALALYVRDPGVGDMADALAAATGQSKTDAVRAALRAALDAEAAKLTLAQRVAPLQAEARALGLSA